MPKANADLVNDTSHCLCISLSADLNLSQGPNFPQEQIRFTANTKIASFIYKAKKKPLKYKTMCPIVLALRVSVKHYMTFAILVKISVLLSY